MDTLAIPFLLLVGSLLALQAGANVHLSMAMGSPYGASMLQLAIAAGVLVAATAAAGSLGAFDLLLGAEAWHLIGGLGSALYITAGILLFPRLGALVAVGLFIAGQMMIALALDGFGWLGVEAEGLTVAGIAGAAAVLIGISLIVRAQAGGGAIDDATRKHRHWIALGLLAGAALPVQGAINSQLRADLDAPLAVGAFSFLIATLAMALALALVVARGGNRPRLDPLDQVPWWGWLGGVCGATYVTAVFLSIPEIGAAPVVALTVTGQQLASAAVDRYGLLGLPRRRISPERLAGVAILLTGVGLITLL
jgi:transporter family-2 protein